MSASLPLLLFFAVAVLATCHGREPSLRYEKTTTTLTPSVPLLRVSSSLVLPREDEADVQVLVQDEDEASSAKHEEEKEEEDLLRIALLRPFATHDYESMISSFDEWASFLPCQMVEPTNITGRFYTVDLFMSIASSFDDDNDELDGLSGKELKDTLTNLFQTSVWGKKSHCFDSIAFISSNIPEEVDLYTTEPNGGGADRDNKLNLLWVNGPNTQFRHSVKEIISLREESHHDYYYDVMFLMEAEYASSYIVSVR